MALNGLPVRSYPYGGVSGPPPNNGLLNQYNLYGKSVHGAEDDYSGIMDAYRRLLQNRSNQPSVGIEDYKPQGFTPKQYGDPESYSPNTYKPPTPYTTGNLSAPGNYKPEQYDAKQYGAPENYSPLTKAYHQSNDLTDAIKNLKGLADNGGYSAEGIADLRERGVSPLRSVYASAQRDIDRSRALSGSTNSYAALKGKMARELSDKIAGATQNVNAGIAQNVASNRLQIAPAYADVTGHQSDLENSINQNNTGILNSANFRNIDNRNRINEQNTDLANSTNRANVDLRNQGNLYNISQTDAYNRSMFDRTNSVNDRNVSNINDTNRANTDLTNQGNLQNIDARNRVNTANTDLFNNVGKSNIDEQNNARRINMELPIKRSALANQNQDGQQQILDSMRNLFSSTPGLANLFGNQALQSASLQNNINQGNNSNAMDMILNLIRQLSGRN